MFTLQRHSLSYGRQRVLKNVSLTIAAGEKVVLVGPSGAGKTSLLNELYHQHSDCIALCPQQQGLVDILSVYNNVYMGQLQRHSALYNASNLIWPRASDRQSVAAVCRRLGLEEKLKVSVDRLSGGQRQRVAIGRALHRQQPVFFGDEPVSSLDPLQGQRILEQVVATHDTVVVALHNRRQALASFDRIIGLVAGEIVLDSPAAEVELATLDKLYALEPER